MLNLAARFREAIEQLSVCPDPILRSQAQELKILVESYDAKSITEAQLKTSIEELDSRLEDGMVKTTCYNILNTPVDLGVDYLHVPPQISTQAVDIPGSN